MQQVKISEDATALKFELVRKEINKQEEGMTQQLLKLKLKLSSEIDLNAKKSRSV